MAKRSRGGNASFNIRIVDHTDDVMNVVHERMRQALSLMGEEVEGNAKEYCPVDTGLLRNSITHTGAGQSVSMSYHASYGSNRSSSGRRYSAASASAGAVGVGRVSGSMGTSDEMSEYVGTNVEYGQYVEFRDSLHHTSGQAHFLRDGAMNHVDRLRSIAESTLR